MSDSAYRDPREAVMEKLREENAALREKLRAEERAHEAEMARDLAMERALRHPSPWPDRIWLIAKWGFWLSVIGAAGYGIHASANADAARRKAHDDAWWADCRSEHKDYECEVLWRQLEIGPRR